MLSELTFIKVSFLCFGNAKDTENNYMQLFGYAAGSLPFTCLGIHIHHKKLTNKEWKITNYRFEKKFSSWKGKLMSYGAHFILINSVLTILPMFILGFFEVTKGVLKRLDFYQLAFFQ